MRIVLADDHVMLRDGVKPYLQELADQVDILEAGSFPEMFKLIGANEPVDLALTDLRMPGMEGLRGLHVLRQRWPAMKIAVLSSIIDRKVINDALSAGVVAYLPKRLSAAAMLSALRLVLAGERFIPAMLLESDMRANRAPQDTQEYRLAGSLTQREKEILHLLRNGMPNKAIARQLNVSEVTIKSHLCHVFCKLGVQNRVQAAQMSLPLEEC